MSDPANERRAFRVEVLKESGATPGFLEVLLAYGEAPSVEDTSPVELPLPDEPHVEAWLAYEREARESGAVETLRQYFAQLKFPCCRRSESAGFWLRGRGFSGRCRTSVDSSPARSATRKRLESQELHRTGATTATEVDGFWYGRHWSSGRCSGATVIRHAAAVRWSASSIPGLASTMKLSTACGPLVATIRLPMSRTAGLTGARVAAIPLAPVAAPADRDARLTAIAEKHAVALDISHL